ncbi:F-box/LRR-repeat protein At3g59250 [Raphanus sativus]|uniref:F-box/LRR-repeat protein At3g59250 n=1 Tax=Raphanus sativus TaxID=3726 RepID=A0A6J0P1A5_RAPSA|nr:F-box/LRR-repeat protein At3g59250 [Raphanus sativus]XP_056866208.1 F-box/LRR-repeat protein At3g59250 [Raphanus sativus]
MSSKRLNLGSKDYISGLPDCLITHILSFISTKEAASTSVLAKRWRYLFALTPNLDFNDSIYLNPGKGRRKKIPSTRKKSKTPTSFVDFVDRALVLHRNVPLNRFSLKCKGVIHPAIVIGWLLKVLERGVLDLDLDISSEMGCPLPSEMFVSETLVRLKIGVRDVITIDKVNDVFLPNIKSLCLDYVMVKKCVFRELLSGCQALEELVLNNLFEFMGSCYVSHNTLKRLVVRRSRTFDENHKSVSFSTPDLVYLDYSDTIADKYPKVEFSSLVEARLDLRMTKDQIMKAKFSNDDRSPPEEMVGNATNFLKGICNVQILYLSDDTLEVLTYCCKPIPAFNNLIHLTIKTDPDVAWESLPALLKNCPKLETLVFEGLHHKFANCWEEDKCLCNLWMAYISTCLSSSPVKVLKILKFGEIFGDDEDIVEQIKQVQHFLETMPNLEQLVLYYETSFDEDVNEVSAQLQWHPKVASPKCKITVISDNHCLSSTVPCSVVRKWGRLL